VLTLAFAVAGITAIVTELTVTPVSPAAALPRLLSSLLLAGAVSRSRSS
jgi:hypothetical protein